jgi:hypothetical protein
MSSVSVSFTNTEANASKVRRPSSAFGHSLALSDEKLGRKLRCRWRPLGIFWIGAQSVEGLFIEHFHSPAGMRTIGPDAERWALFVPVNAKFMN